MLKCHIQKLPSLGYAFAGRRYNTRIGVRYKNIKIVQSWFSSSRGIYQCHSKTLNIGATTEMWNLGLSLQRQDDCNPFTLANLTMSTAHSAIRVEAIAESRWSIPNPRSPTQWHIQPSSCSLWFKDSGIVIQRISGQRFKKKLTPTSWPILGLLTKALPPFVGDRRLPSAGNRLLKPSALFAPYLLYRPSAARLIWAETG